MRWEKLDARDNPGEQESGNPGKPKEQKGAEIKESLRMSSPAEE